MAYALVGDDEPTAADAARCLSGRTFGGLTKREIDRDHSVSELDVAVVDGVEPASTIVSIKADEIIRRLPSWRSFSFCLR